MEREFNVLGKATRRKDGVARVTGQERYTPDISLPRMLHGRILSSPYAHARVKSIDTSAAEALGAVVITFDDIPKVRYNERIITIPSVLHKDHYVLADKVRRMGEAVAAVAAETEALAEKALRAIKVEYEVLPVLTDPIAAMQSPDGSTSSPRRPVEGQSPEPVCGASPPAVAPSGARGSGSGVDEGQPGAEPIYETVLWGDREIEIENNIACERAVEEGDVDHAFAEADVIVEGTFKTPKIYHAQMETKSVVCRPEPDGGLTVWPTTQSIHNVRILLGQIFDIPLSKINVKRVPVGGTFGSSIQMNPPIPICAALALKARRPVKLTLTREEDVHDHTRYGTQIHLKLAARDDGTLTGAQMELIADIGAHNIQAYSFLGVCVGWLVSLYRLPNVRYKGTAVYTNKAISCAMQGFGNPQVTFAVESLMDALAERLGMDPLELRLKNYVGLGDTFWGQGPLVRSIVQSDGVPELLREGARQIGWERRVSESASQRYRRGIGLARGFHTSSAGAPQPGDVIDFSGAMVKLNVDGSVDVITALMDHGGGTLEALAKLVAEALCVPLDRVNLAPAETCSTVYDCVTHATRGVYAGGGAAVKAAEGVRQELLQTAARYLNVMPEALALRLDEELGQGVVYAPAIPDRQMTLSQIATRCWTESWKTIASVVSYRPVHCPPAYVSVFLEVKVDTWTGQVHTLRAAMGSDCGTVVNPDMAAGQLEGGLSKGAGFALYESNEWDADGQIKGGGYWIDAKTPSISESPCLGALSVHFADTYEPSGPFGAKGIGEAATNPVAAAYANAIYNAIGIRFYELPITPEKILWALSQEGES
jgi:xanthine dehydrogenase molybdenum-binding subunit